MKLRTVYSKISFFVAALLFFTAAFYSCKKTDVDSDVNNKKLYAEKFFENPAGSTAEVQALIDLLKDENEKTGFVNTLPDNAGLPVWGKLIIEKPNPKPGYAARGIIADKNGNLLIPLSNNSKTLSALLFAIKKDGKYQFYCYDNNYAYSIAFNKEYSIKEREKVMGLFLSMSNYVFGLHEFKNIPIDLFSEFGGKPEPEGKTKKIYLVPYKESNTGIGDADRVLGNGPISLCGYNFSGNCSCANPTNPNDDPNICQDWWKPCPQNVCSIWSCKTFWYLEEDPNNPNYGDEDTDPKGVLNNFSMPGPANSSPSNFINGGLPNAVCSNNCAWYTEAAEQNFEESPNLSGHLGTSVEPQTGITNDDPDNFWWEDNTTDYPAQNLPSWSDMNANYPKKPDGTEKCAEDVFNEVGGQVQAIGGENACALRMSIALNKSGVVIPNIPGHTFSGADGKYYFLSAAKLYNFMRKTFKIPPNPTGSRLSFSGAQGGTDGENFPGLLSGKKGIYLMRPNFPGYFGATGHASLFDGSSGVINNCDPTHTSDGTYFNDCDGGIHNITLWQLN